MPIGEFAAGVFANAGPPAGSAYSEADFHATEYLRLDTISLDWRDSTPPVATVSLVGTLGSSGWWLSDPVATLRAVDPETCVTALYYSADGAPWRKVEVDPFHPETAFKVAGDGVHTIEYYAQNGKGQAGSPQRLEVRIDKTPPTAVLTAPRPGVCYVQDMPVHVGVTTCAVGTMLTLKASASDATSGVRHVEFHGHGPVGVDEAQPYTWAWNLLHAFGWRTPRACAEDVAGNRACHTGPETLLVP